MIQKELTYLERKQNENQEKIDSLFLQIDQLYKKFNTAIKSQPQQSYGQLISKVILFNIISNLEVKQIIEMRRVNRQFNNLIIVCLPFILDLLNHKIQFIEQNFPAAYLNQYELFEVNFYQMEKNLEKIERYDDRRQIHPENLLCLNLMFDLITMNRSDMEKAQNFFYLKIQILKWHMYKNKFFLHYFDLTDQQQELIKSRFFSGFREIRYEEEQFDDFNKYVQNLMRLVQLPNYKELRNHYQKQIICENMRSQYKVLQNLIKCNQNSEEIDQINLQQ